MTFQALVCTEVGFEDSLESIRCADILFVKEWIHLITRVSVLLKDSVTELCPFMDKDIACK